MIQALAFFRPGIWELVVVGLVIVLVFGTRRLPDIGRSLGRAIRNFQNSFKGEDEGTGRGEDS